MRTPPVAKTSPIKVLHGSAESSNFHAVTGFFRQNWLARVLLRGTDMSMSPFKFLLQFTVVSALALPLLAGCSVESDDGDAVSSTGDELTACNAGRKTAYQGGRNLGAIKLMKIDDKLTSVKTGHAYLKLKKQMASRGVTLSINSGFRTQEEQQYFYNCYQSKRCNDGNKAARPGFSNHQHGRALDLQINNHAAFKRALRALGLTSQWKNTVAGERWHWEYFGSDPGGVCDADSAGSVEETPGGALDTDEVEGEQDQVEDYASGDDAPDFSDENIPDDAPEDEGDTQTAATHDHAH